MGFKSGMAFELDGVYFFCMHSDLYAGPDALERLLWEIDAAAGAPAALVSLRLQRGETYMVDYLASGAGVAADLRRMQAAGPRSRRFFRWADHRFVPAAAGREEDDACLAALDCALGCHAQL
jgi:hypothetical protein